MRRLAFGSGSDGADARFRHHSLSLIQTVDNGRGIFNGRPKEMCDKGQSSSLVLYALIKQAKELANDRSNDGRARHCIYDY